MDDLETERTRKEIPLPVGFSVAPDKHGCQLTGGRVVSNGVPMVEVRLELWVNEEDVSTARELSGKWFLQLLAAWAIDGIATKAKRQQERMERVST